MVHQLFIDFKKAHDSVRREVLYSILIEFGICRKLVGLIKMCLSETYSTVHIGKFCLKSFLFRLAWNKETHYHHCFATCFDREGPREPGRTEIEWNT
jgi:hypothetical protein